MNDNLYKINVFYGVTDFLLCAIGVAAFTGAAFFFGKWWLILFAVLPLCLYTNHGLIIESDLKQSKVEELKPKGAEDGKT